MHEDQLLTLSTRVTQLQTLNDRNMTELAAGTDSTAQQISDIKVDLANELEKVYEARLTDNAAVFDRITELAIRLRNLQSNG